MILKLHNYSKFLKKLKTHPKILDIIFIVLIIIISVYFIICWYSPFIYPSSDGGSILTLAKSFVEGKGYRDISIPGEPIHSHYPFGWPFLLSFVIGESEFNYTSVHLLTSCFFVLSGIVLYFLGRCFFKRTGSFIVSFAFITHNLICILNQTAFSEIPFSFFLFSCLLTFTIARRTNNTKFYVISMILAILTSFMRVIGEVVIVSLILILIFDKRWRLIYLFVIMILVKITLHFVLQDTEWISNSYVITDIPGIRLLFNTSNLSAETTYSFSVIDFCKLYLLNIKRMLLTFIPIQIFPTMYHSFNMNLFKILLNLTISFSVFLGIALLIKKKNYLISLSVLMMLSVILTWTNPDAVYRYYAPLASIFVMFSLTTLNFIYNHIPQNKKYQYLFRTFLLILMILFITDRVLYNKKQLNESFFRLYPEATIDYQDFCTCISTAFPENTIQYAPVNGMTYIFSQRKTLRFPWKAKKPQEWCDLLKRHNTLIIIPGWWQFMAKFSINRFDSILTNGNLDGYYKIQYGFPYPTNAYYKIGDIEIEKIYNSLQKCTNYGKLQIQFIP